MKKLFLCGLMVAAFVPFLAAEAQILNPGFETWVSGNPDKWLTNNVPGFYTPISQSTDVHAGSSSMKGSVVAYSTSTVAPLAYSGTSGAGFTAPARYGSITGYLKFTQVSGDSFVVLVMMLKGATMVGIGSYGRGPTVSSFTPFTVPIQYLSGVTPDTAWIEMTIVAGSGQSETHIGSAFTIDDVAYGAVTSVDNEVAGSPGSFELRQNYPNPFNPSTSIDYSVPQKGHATLKVYDLLGNEVATLVNGELERGSYSAVWNAANSSSGVYFYRLTSGSYSATRKLILMR